MPASILANSARAAEIISVVSRHEWQFVKQLINQANPDSPRLPLPEVLCSILTELGPVYVKLGQLLSTRADLLSEPYIDALSQLQSDVPAVAWDRIEPMLLEELGQRLVQHSRRALGARGATVAVVHADEERWRSYIADDERRTRIFFGMMVPPRW